MTVGLLFWILMIAAFFYSGWGFVAADGSGRRYFGVGFLSWLLLFLLGWRVFGFIVQ